MTSHRPGARQALSAIRFVRRAERRYTHAPIKASNTNQSNCRRISTPLGTQARANIRCRCECVECVLDRVGRRQGGRAGRARHAGPAWCGPDWLLYPQATCRSCRSGSPRLEQRSRGRSRARGGGLSPSVPHSAICTQFRPTAVRRASEAPPSLPQPARITRTEIDRPAGRPRIRSGQDRRRRLRCSARGGPWALPPDDARKVNQP